MNNYELQERLIAFSVLIVDLSSSMPVSKQANHLSSQIIRSGTSPALNYAEAQAGESRNDFTHKIKIVLKELRETDACLKIIHRKKNYSDDKMINQLLKENNELISIFVKSLKTLEENQKKLRLQNLKEKIKNLPNGPAGRFEIKNRISDIRRTIFDF